MRLLSILHYPRGLIMMLFKAFIFEKRLSCSHFSVFLAKSMLTLLLMHVFLFFFVVAAHIKWVVYRMSMIDDETPYFLLIYYCNAYRFSADFLSVLTLKKEDGACVRFLTVCLLPFLALGTGERRVTFLPTFDRDRQKRNKWERRHWKDKPTNSEQRPYGH